MPSLNNDVREMKTRLNKLSSGNRAGVPFKKNVDQAKKETRRKTGKINVNATSKKR